MPVTINRISFQQRIDVTGDPTVAGAIPCTVNVGDTVYRSDGGQEYLVTAAGLVLGSSLDESPVYTSVTYSTLLSSTTALATPSALAATALNAFASTVSGAVLMGFGTTDDVALKNQAGTTVLGITANTTGVQLAGALAITGALTGVTSFTASTTGTITGKLTVTGTVTASGAVADGTALTVTPTAAANNDVLTGLKVTVAAGTPGSFTGLVRRGIAVPAYTVVGDTSPGDPVGISVGIITGTGASVASALSLAPPTGATTNYLMRHTTAATFNVTDGGALTQAGVMTILGGTAIPASGTTGSGYKFSSTANFGVFFGSGAPTLTAAKGSLYLRSDGTGIADRAYINTDSGTTWTAIATAA